MQIVSTRLHRASGQVGILFEGEGEILLPWKVTAAPADGDERDIALAMLDERSIRYLAGEFDTDEFEVRKAVDAYRSRYA